MIFFLPINIYFIDPRLAGDAKKDTELKTCLCFGKIISQANEILLAFLHPITPESSDIKVTYFSVSRANLLSSNTSVLPGFEPPKETGLSSHLSPTEKSHWWHNFPNHRSISGPSSPFQLSFTFPCPTLVLQFFFLNQLFLALH